MRCAWSDMFICRGRAWLQASVQTEHAGVYLFWRLHGCGIAKCTPVETRHSEMNVLGERGSLRDLRGLVKCVIEEAEYH